MPGETELVTAAVGAMESAAPVVETANKLANASSETIKTGVETAMTIPNVSGVPGVGDVSVSFEGQLNQAMISNPDNIEGFLAKNVAGDSQNTADNVASSPSTNESTNTVSPVDNLKKDFDPNWDKFAKTVSTVKSSSPTPVTPSGVPANAGSTEAVAAGNSSVSQGSEQQTPSLENFTPDQIAKLDQAQAGYKDGTLNEETEVSHSDGNPTKTEVINLPNPTEVTPPAQEGQELSNQEGLKEDENKKQKEEKDGAEKTDEEGKELTNEQRQIQEMQRTQQEMKTQMNDMMEVQKQTRTELQEVKTENAQLKEVVSTQGERIDKLENFMQKFDDFNLKLQEIMPKTAEEMVDPKKQLALWQLILLFFSSLVAGMGDMA